MKRKEDKTRGQLSMYKKYSSSFSYEFSSHVSVREVSWRLGVISKAPKRFCKMCFENNGPVLL